MRRIGCPHCGKFLKYQDSDIGKKVRCPKCKNVFRVKPQPLSDEEMEKEIFDVLDESSLPDENPGGGV